jgi:hypothetical protein
MMLSYVYFGTNDLERAIYAAYVRDPDGNKVAAVCRGYSDPPKRM